MTLQSLFASSVSRYNGGIATKRAHGSATITVFIIGLNGSAPSTWEEIKGFGPKPGERATYAKRVYLARHGATAHASAGV